MKRFKFIELNETFMFRNTRFKKVSSRTARAIDDGNKVFYFSQNEYSDRLRKPLPVY
jgi:hypothetical protein